MTGRREKGHRIGPRSGEAANPLPLRARGAGPWVQVNAVHGRRDLVVPSVVAVVVMYVMTAVHLHDSGVLCF